MKILIVEDEKIINDNIKTVFVANSFIVDQAFDGDQAKIMALSNIYDLMIVDVNIPKISGIEVVKYIRAEGIKTPIIILSARDSLDIKMQAFNAGVDDYLVKPFDLKILVLKVKALLERINNQGTKVFLFSGIKVDVEKKLVQSVNSSAEISLTSREYMILEYLLLNNNKYISAEELLEHVWDNDVDNLTQSVKIHISNIRKKLGNVIETKKGIGYKVKAKLL